MSESLPETFLAFLKTLSENELSVLTEMSSKNVYTINKKIYQYHPLSVKKYKELEKVRADWQVERLKTGDDYNPHLVSSKYMEIYVKGAEYFFGMTPEEFDNAEWTEIQMAVDAANFRTLHGSGFLSKRSTTTSDSTEKSS